MVCKALLLVSNLVYLFWWNAIQTIANKYMFIPNLISLRSTSNGTLTELAKHEL